MNKLITLALIALTSITSGCAIVEHQLATDEVNTSAREMQHFSTKANVYVFINHERSSGLMGISINDTDYGWMNRHQMVNVLLDEGKHTITTQVTLAVSSSIELEVEAGANYYIMLGDDLFPSPGLIAVWSLLTSEEFITLVDQDTAQPFIQQSNLFN